MADVAIVLDHSGSIDGNNPPSTPNFNLMKESLKNLIDQDNFVIGPDDILMGAVKFGTSASLQFNLLDNQSENDLKDAVHSTFY